MLYFFLAAACLFTGIYADNQTPDVSPILSADESPFDVQIDRLWFHLPMGVQGYVIGHHHGKWLLLAGRINGLHGFNNDPNNFPPNQQNTYAFVVDFEKKTAIYRSLSDPDSGLTQEQIDSLSVTAPQAYQDGKTLYISGGYGFQTSTLQFITWPYLTAVDIPAMIRWVSQEEVALKASDCIRQAIHPLLKVTGGCMDKLGKKGPTLLVFGQDFEGTYFFGEHTQVYTEQVRKLHIKDNGVTLGVEFVDPDISDKTPSYRRRDLNIVRVLHRTNGRIQRGLVALSGVFTETGGIWTVPVWVNRDGSATMDDPADPLTFKQGGNNYASANVGLYSKKKNEMYLLLFGGLTYEYFVGGVPQFDTEIPFTNQVTAIKIDAEKKFSQYLLNGAFPEIPSTGSNPGNPLLFGATASFFPRCGVKQYMDEVIKYDSIRKPTVIGYILGGIQSTLPNTNTMSDSAASPYVFKVTLIPKEGL